MTMTREQELKVLKSKRQQVYDRLERVGTFLDTFNPVIHDIDLVTARLEPTIDSLKEFNSLQDEIDTKATAAEIETETNFRLDFERMYYLAIGKIKSLIRNYENQREHQSPQAGAASTSSTASVSSNSKLILPSIQLPEFDGNFSKWLSFRDVFKSLVNDNQNLSNIEKLHYLRTSLKGEALRAIESFTVSSANYTAAWDHINKRFENTRLIAQAHIRNIFNTPTVTKASYDSLRKLIDDIQVNLESLKMLQIETGQWDPFLVTIIGDKLDFHSSREWQSLLKTDQLPTLQQLLDFLETRCNHFEIYSKKIANTNNPNFNNISSVPKQSKFENKFQNNTKFLYKNQSSVHASIKGNNSCFFCKNNHFLHQCSEFLKLTIIERTKEIEKMKLCSNCFRKHNIVDCKSTSNCRVCNSRHNTLLHPTETQNPLPSTSASNHSYLISKSENLLSTAIILIKDQFDNFQECRALLDNGSQSNFITRALCKKLGLQTFRVNHRLIFIDKTESKCTEMVEISIKSKHNDYTADLNCLTLQQITEPLPTNSFATDKLNIPHGICLADETFNISRPIDLLIGSQLFLDLLKNGKIQLRPQLYLQNSELGWIISGPLNFETSKTSKNLSVNNFSRNLDLLALQNLHKQVIKFWELEDCKAKIPTVNNICEQHFVETFTRTNDGRFMVSLPVRDNCMQLGFSKERALKRFTNLENRLNKDGTLKSSYIEFMREYETLGHMERVPATEINNPNTYYIPHHAVFKGSKIRVVFDASMKSSNNLSLNDNLLTGPTIQQDIFSITLRFRTYQYVISSDIIKMYRQVKLNPLDCDFQRIFWRESQDQPLEIYRLTTVTYGTASAPFLAVRCLKQLAYDHRENYPEACKKIESDFYVDDLLSGADTLNDAITLRDQIQHILSSGGFQLSKWASNASALIPESADQSNNNTINLDKENTNKTLGLFWKCKEDTLGYKTQLDSSSQTSSKLTKKHMLSKISQIFDPLGLVSPITIKAKLLLQQCWSRNLEWNQIVPPDIQHAWLTLINELQDLDKIKINRKVFSNNNIVNTELHGFADASAKAYGAAVYLRTIDANNKIECHLLTAKSRVAPIKTTTIPRLELMAAVLLCDLTERVLEILYNVAIHKKTLWTDSTIVLAWLSQPSTQWQTFVANRVSHIQSKTNLDEWRHIKSNDNPADIVSRGMSPCQLIQSKLWWHGPPFLSKNANEWPNFLQLNTTNEIPEQRKRVATVITSNSEATLINIERFSNYNRLIRTAAYVLRFINNCKPNTTKTNEKDLTIEEIASGRNLIIKIVQKQSFHKEINNLKLNGTVDNTSSLLSLSPFIDSEEIIRVGGRLRHSNLPFNIKHPILLPKGHHFSKLVIRHFHSVQLHAGAQATLAAIRQQYWIISSRSEIRHILHKCIRCFKIKPNSVHQKMGDLPKQRLEPQRPFLITGIDYCGPIYVKEGRGRGKRSVKAFIALFICLCTKAVHVELVSDLTSEAFLNALRRFISRRGTIKELHSDNGTNFVGANRELQQVSQILNSQNFNEIVLSNLKNQNIKWVFTPPRSPNFGGLWESNIKSLKLHLKKVIGSALLTFEEMYTLLSRIEACLNSRPITPISNDPNDFMALTPGHFLIGDALTAPVEQDVRQVQVNRLNRWQLLEQMRQQFWDRFRREYITQLQRRNKWKSPSSITIKPGALVLLVEDNTPPLCWPMGRIEEIHPGSDGLPRVVTVRTNKGAYKRGITKICVLPMEEEVHQISDK